MLDGEKPLVEKAFTIKWFRTRDVTARARKKRFFLSHIVSSLFFGQKDTIIHTITVTGADKHTVCIFIRRANNYTRNRRRQSFSIRLSRDIAAAPRKGARKKKPIIYNILMRRVEL